MPQHPPIEEDLAQRAHGIGKEDVYEGHRTGHSRLQAEAARIDQFERTMEYRDAGIAYPSSRGDGQCYPNNDRGIKCKYRTDG